MRAASASSTSSDSSRRSVSSASIVRFRLARGGLLDQRPHARQQLGEHALALAVFIAREQRRQLDRDAVGRLGRRGDLAARDRVDRVGIRRQVSLGVVLGAGALAQHVVREAQAGGGVGAAAARGSPSPCVGPALLPSPRRWFDRARTGGPAAGSRAPWRPPRSSRRGASAGRRRHRPRAGTSWTARSRWPRCRPASCAGRRPRSRRRTRRARAGRR